ncbi:AAA family ATPase [Caenispirillum bisanense]|uniref:Exonuclease SbcC n=1 Tax=Caenispirillum bisanense TaxID=414052 RepID=A0A286G5E9_9PROT|nr:AAA family ATPase [Caenispirillum bisanense]SOD90715.1 exonuclease SbcC [Caenispirillum bisanense]
MRILAIRGRNLTSLAGDFAVDFEDGPLAAAGLFAITGPTGAGKSTLLDCLCLALYDRFPRLENAARVAVGAAGADATMLVTGTDPRTILRHGAAEGFAEVDFVGRDGGRYRARWEVRRARNKADGKLQAQGMSLTCLTTGGQLGGTKTETLAAIGERTGLTFEQFRRSVLLAQGDFDAFLKAKPADRADLLELMTGTEVYGRLSQAAYERHKAERGALDALEMERRALAILSPEDRAEAERLVAEAEAEAKAAQEGLDGLRAQIAWHRETRRLAQAVTEGETALAAAEAAQDEAAPERARLAALRRLHRLRPVVAEADRLEAEAARLSAAATEAGARVERTAAALATAEAARDAARTALAKAEAAFKDAGPQLDAAADLDSRIHTAAEHKERCAAVREKEVAACARAEAAPADHTRARDAAARTAAEARDWLAAHEGHRLLADQTDRWTAALADWAAASAARDAAAAKGAARAASVTDLTARKNKREAQRSERTEALVAAERDLTPVVERLAALDPDALEDRRLAAAGRADAVAALVALARSARDVAERQTALSKRVRTAAAARDAAAEAVAAVGRERPEVDARLSEARRALDLSRAAADEVAARLRGLLRDGDPCPVCGSPDHPLAHTDTAFDGLVREQQARVREFEQQMRLLDDRWRTAAAERDAAAAILDACHGDERRLKAEADRIAADWTEALPRAPLADLPPEPAAADAGVLEAAVAETAQALAAATDELKQAAQLRGEIDRRKAQIDQMRLEIAQHGDTLSTLGESLAKAEAERTAAEQEAARAARAAEAAAAALAAPLAALPGWQERAAADAAAVIAEVEALAAAYAGRRAALTEAEAETQRLAAAIGAAEAEARAARARRDEAGASLDEAAQRLARLTAARAGLFGGEPTQAVRSRLNQARLHAQEHADRTAAACAEVQAARTAAEAAAEDLRRRLRETRDALTAAVAARDAALADAGASLAEARTALAVSDEALTEAEERVRRLDEAVGQARAVLADRRDALARHRETPAPEDDEEALAARALEAEALCETARQRGAEQRARLAHDARQRDKGADLAARIAAQRKTTDLWAALNEVIGSANGDKFRRFAQSLTLDRLLMLANCHLEELTARYVLQRAPGGELDLQVVDREMGDEVRGVGSLSGGERFLVSLALALGLASMSGERSLVESLFIDEGFGALDADSLDVALSALEALQATGRKVGVISHVQAMVDRIGVQIRVAKAGGGRSVVACVQA